MWIAAGRPSRALQLYEQALRTATDNGEPYPRATADLHVGLAELDLELDDLSGAEEHLEAARILGERSSITENRHRWSVVMSRVRAARGDAGSAMQLLDQAAALFRHGFYPDVRPIGAMQARLQVATGDLASAASWSEERGLSVDADPDFLHEYELLTLVRLLLAEHRAGQSTSGARLEAVRALLERLYAAAVDAGRDGSVLEIRMLQALVHDAGGDRDSALEVLGRALAEDPEPESHVRLYLDEGAAMRDLLTSAAHQDQDQIVRDRARRLLERLQPVPEGRTAQPALVDPLSQRELEVLRLLDSELTGPQIADELYVSLNTLRTHTKRIFTKLDVKTRAAAVRSAHEHGLI